MNNPFEYMPDEECNNAFRALLEHIEGMRLRGREEDAAFIREIEGGKMLGVLVAADDKGAHHILYAFSGQIGDGGFRFPGFVGPVFDYLEPGGYFRRKEREISGLNAEIAHFEKTILRQAETEYDSHKAFLDAETEAYREKCRQSKSEREHKRMSGLATPDELAAMVRQSQFEKAELHRLKKRVSAQLAPYVEALQKAREHIAALRNLRRKESESLQNWLFTNFNLLNARGENRSLMEIFSATVMEMPPSGAGECCGPKLLQAAYLKGWHPLSMAEYWYGRAKDGEVRIHGHHYPACRGKCLPVLGWMLQGLPVVPPLGEERGRTAAGDPEIVFENEWFCVVSKPEGMLSVPGKGKAVSVQSWLERKYGSGRGVKVVHRLDRDTSGLLVAAFGERPYKELQALFAERKVSKTYVAELDGDYSAKGIARSGRIELPLSPDWLDRPRQRVDLRDGKMAVTDYEFEDVEDGRSRVIFHPLTGRTHQLRVHSASDSGLGMPIVGDPLYGKNGHTGDRLRLHAFRLEFIYPADGHHYRFELPVPF